MKMNNALHSVYQVNLEIMLPRTACRVTLLAKLAMEHRLNNVKLAHLAMSLLLPTYAR